MTTARKLAVALTIALSLVALGSGFAMAANDTADTPAGNVSDAPAYEFEATSTTPGNVSADTDFPGCCNQARAGDCERVCDRECLAQCIDAGECINNGECMNASRCVGPCDDATIERTRDCSRSCSRAA